jgi:hypothetical protein
MGAVAAAVVVAVALAVASSNLSRFVEANRPRLEETLRAELGRTITTGPVALSFDTGPVCGCATSVPDDPFGGDLLRAERVTVRLLPARSALRWGASTSTPVVTPPATTAERRPGAAVSSGPTARRRRQRTTPGPLILCPAWCTTARSG